MDRMDGVGIRLTVEGVSADISRTAYVGEIAKIFPGCESCISVHVPRGRNIYGISVDGKKNVALKKDCVLCEEPPYEGRMYQTFVQVKKGKDGAYHTEYPDNNMRLLEIESNGTVRLWEIALISQASEFFITVQKVYEAQCYHDKGGSVVCPPFAKWPQMNDLLVKLMAGIELPVAGECKEETQSEKLPSNTARVVWFNLAQGFGMLATPDGPARVHWREIAKREAGLAYLVSGEYVRYEKLRDPVQTKPRQTSFQKEATGVIPGSL